MKKPKPYKKVEISYFDMEHYIEEKYGCDIDDYAAHKNGIKSSTSQFNCEYEENWKLKNYPRLAELRKNPVTGYGLSQEGMDFYNTTEGNRWFHEMHEAYQKASDGECKELPNWCFWHYMVDSYGIFNGITCSINWENLATCGEDWQKEICKLFAKEFGNKDMEVNFSW